MSDDLTTQATALEALRGELGGELVLPGDATYDDARSVWNGMIDLRPAAVARCASAADVAAAVRAARGAGLEIAVRGGGHNVAGLGTSEGGLVIDLSPLGAVDVDVPTRTVRVGGGATLGDLDSATQEHGLVVPAGVVSETGVAGLTLSGGLGYLRRAWGLSCDSLVGAELVTATGEIVSVDEAGDPELLWGLRGGGGNFGVVTELVFRAQTLGPEVAFLFVLYPIAQARHVLAEHERLVEASGDAISTIAVLGHVPPIDDLPAALHGEPYVALVGMFAGDADAGEAALRPLRELAEPLADFSDRMDYVDAQKVYDPDYPSGHRYYWKSCGLRALPEDVVDELVEQTLRAPSQHSTIDVWLNGGAMARVGEDATAFTGRSDLYLVNPEANWEDGADDAANIAWARGVLEALEQHATGAAYPNFPGLLEEGAAVGRRAYGSGYDRLALLKARLDPDNVFRRNANVAPAG